MSSLAPSAPSCPCASSSSSPTPAAVGTLTSSSTSCASLLTSSARYSWTANGESSKSANGRGAENGSDDEGKAEWARVPGRRRVPRGRAGCCAGEGEGEGGASLEGRVCAWPLNEEEDDEPPGPGRRSRKAWVRAESDMARRGQRVALRGARGACPFQSSSAWRGVSGETDGDDEGEREQAGGEGASRFARVKHSPAEAR